MCYESVAQAAYPETSPLRAVAPSVADLSLVQRVEDLAIEKLVANPKLTSKLDHQAGADQSLVQQA